jgi:hypothetical protein
MVAEYLSHQGRVAIDVPTAGHPQLPLLPTAIELSFFCFSPSLSLYIYIYIYIYQGKAVWEKGKGKGVWTETKFRHFRVDIYIHVREWMIQWCEVIIKINIIFALILNLPSVRCVLYQCYGYQPNGADVWRQNPSVLSPCLMFIW